MAAAVVLRVRVRIAFVVAVHALQLRDARIRIGGFRPRKQRRRTRSAGQHLHPAAVRQYPADVLLPPTRRRREVSVRNRGRGGRIARRGAHELHVPHVARRNQPPQTDGLSTAGIDARPHRFRTGDGRVPHHRRGNRVRRYGDQHHRPKEERGIHQSPAGQGIFVPGPRRLRQPLDAQAVRQRLPAGGRRAARLPHEAGPRPPVRAPKSVSIRSVRRITNCTRFPSGNSAPHGRT